MKIEKARDDHQKKNRSTVYFFKINPFRRGGSSPGEEDESPKVERIRPSYHLPWAILPNFRDTSLKRVGDFIGRWGFFSPSPRAREKTPSVGTLVQDERCRKYMATHCNIRQIPSSSQAELPAGQSRRAETIFRSAADSTQHGLPYPCRMVRKYSSLERRPRTASQVGVLYWAHLWAR